MDCPLQTVHLCLLKHILGIKRTTPNRSVLRDCGHGPLQFYWFCAAVRFYNALLRSNSTTLSKPITMRAPPGVCRQFEDKAERCVEPQSFGGA
eukprot:1156693-Pelagomonas_calceolata.AAC.5